ncbi:unnamed protein product [Cyprideis torosa]|uniref:Uncharacterized protein n=1 Tax=Cyprideis torosa TaxID=163714 RepID=A0A7R8WQE6_9CRUS|nr:unnamed protein product [Cyprideis torosa]CAG0906609.1 unnamed protein product [Cyprideis torosa]
MRNGSAKMVRFKPATTLFGSLPFTCSGNAKTCSLRFTRNGSAKKFDSASRAVEVLRRNEDPVEPCNADDSLSIAIVDHAGLSTKFIALEPGDNVFVTLNIEENIILSTDDMPCNSETGYTYSKCMDDCAKEQFLTGEMYDRENFTRCQIPGFQNVTELEPCRDLEQTNNVLWKYVVAALPGEQLESCEEKCPSSCKQLAYKYQIKRELAWDNASLSLINFQKMRTVTTQQWSYGGLDMAADVGGYVGALLGISLLSISHDIIQRLRRMLQKQEQKWIRDSN